MDRVHGIHRKRRRVNSNTGKLQVRWRHRRALRAGGCLRSEPNPTVTCACITRELLIRFCFVCLRAHHVRAFAPAHFWFAVLALRILRGSFGRVLPWCPHLTHVGDSTQVAASDHAEEDWQVRASHLRVGYLSLVGAAGPPHRLRADSQPALGPLG